MWYRHKGFTNDAATEVEGTFRVNGSNKRMRELQAIFETPPKVSFHYSRYFGLLSTPADRLDENIWINWRALHRHRLPSRARLFLPSHASRTSASHPGCHFLARRAVPALLQQCPVCPDLARSFDLIPATTTFIQSHRIWRDAYSYPPGCTVGPPEDSRRDALYIAASLPGNASPVRARASCHYNCARARTSSFSRFWALMQLVHPPLGHITFCDRLCSVDL